MVEAMIGTCEACEYPNIDVFKDDSTVFWLCTVCRRIPRDDEIKAIAWGVNHVLAMLEARNRAWTGPS